MANFNRFGNMFPSPAAMERSFVMYEEPFRIAGNLYFAGNTWCSSHLIDTGDALIVLDVPCISELAYFIEAVYRLGFKLRDIKHIFVSHAHLDHYGSVNALVHLTGAKTYMGEIDVKDMADNREWFEGHGRGTNGSNEPFVADFAIKDGEVTTIGNTAVRWVLTPGHTTGCMSHFWNLTDDDGKQYRVGIYGGAGYGALSTDQLTKRGVPLSLQQSFVNSLHKVWDEPVDIMLGNHPFHNDTFDKWELSDENELNPFIDPTEWIRYLTEIRDGFERFLSLPPDQLNEMYSQSQMYLYRPALEERERKAYE